jgi:hypothetical protein
MSVSLSFTELAERPDPARRVGLMTISATPATSKELPQRGYGLFAGVLSYLVPGLGQISQGRFGKGLLFFIGLYGLFFYGQYLGSWSNVYIAEPLANNKPWDLPDLIINLYNRPQFVGQFWIGIAAWPAVWQYNHLPVPSETQSPFWHTFQRMPPEQPDKAPPDWQGKSLNELQTEGDKTWDLGWVFTVIAGVLNVLVIYDAAAGPALGASESPPEKERMAA